MSPPAARGWRNNSDAPLYFLCIQYRADSVIEGGTHDGVRVDAKPIWPSWVRGIFGEKKAFHSFHQRVRPARRARQQLFAESNRIRSPERRSHEHLSHHG